MPAYDESFAPEPEQAMEPAPDTTATAAETPEAAPVEVIEQPEATEATETPEAPAEGSEESTTEAAPTETAAEEATTEATAPAFVEADYLKSVLGDTAPATAAELRTRFEQLQAKQITPEQEARLALFSDPAKLAEFSQLATKDYDKLDAVEAMRERFAHLHPDMSEAARERRFQRQFADKYPTLADAIANPENYEPTDPALLAEKEDADYDAKTDRAALKTAQQDRTTQFLASHAPAATQPQLTAEQQADNTALPKWLDEAYKEGATIPVDAGDGLKFNLPVPNAAEFKAAFLDPFSLLDKFTLTKPVAEGGIINRENHALATAFLQNPSAFVQNIAKAARAAMPKPAPAIPIADLTNSSAAKAAAAKKAAAVPVTATGEANHPAYVNADDWHNSNI